MSAKADPFGTEDLRAGVLQAWRSSPTRFTEDANAEEDLRIGGYADRLFVELAQNAADAAKLAGVPGRIRVTVENDELRVANTGAPLDTAGVAALASLRASAKRGGVTVGRFGVGFAAVLAVSAEPRVVSRAGGVVFSEARTQDTASTLPELAGQLTQRSGAVPVLRLVWPTADDEGPVPAGFDTEVRLPLRQGVDADSLLAEVAAEVDDLMLTLPVIERIEVAGAAWTRTMADPGDVEISGPDRTRRWRVHEVSGEFTVDEAATLGIEAAQHPRWTVLWALPITEDGTPIPLGTDVLHAPTATDERLSLPARLIATAPIEPSRRRVLAGPAVSAVLRAAAHAYPDLATLVPAQHRALLVPEGGFPLSEVDARLRELIADRLRERPWLAAAAGQRDLPGARARVLEVHADALVEHLADALPDLVGPPLTGPRVARTLASAGATPVGVGELIDELATVARDHSWWSELYGLLLPLLDSHAVTVEDLAGIGVPLVDGRTAPGVRGVLLPGIGSELLDVVAAAEIVGLRIAHPDVIHPLLQRLGAISVDASELLDSPALRSAVERSVEDASAGVDTASLTELVLRLVADTSAVVDRDWLGALALTSADGDVRRADELLAPDAPLLDVLDPDGIGEDGVLAVLDSSIAARWSSDTLAAVGVKDTFSIVTEADPVAPDHDLPDEAQWWDSMAEPPAQLCAVADLDLVADDAWPAALRLLAARPHTWHALTSSCGYTRWWLARFALLAGQSPRQWRLPGTHELAGLYSEVPDVDVPVAVLRTVGVRGELTVVDVEDAADLLERLADPARSPAPGTVLRAHAALADFGRVDEPPETVRALDGSVVDAEDASVLDEPWLLEIAEPGALVAGTCAPEPLADALDLPLASDIWSAEVVSTGDLVAWRELGAVSAVAGLLGVPVPVGGLWIHPELVVRVDGDTRSVRWWLDGDQVHAEDSETGLAWAFAQLSGLWERRHLVAALLEDPTTAVMLG